VSTDITDAGAIEQFATSLYDNGAAPDLLFNNAGRFVSMAPIWDSDPSEWWADVRVNVLGVYTVTRAILPLMLRRDQGIIVNMGGRPLRRRLRLWGLEGWSRRVHPGAEQ
jgi:3-hydroxy acid dehydrogenase / malonic semialdehyde reductase